MPFLAEAWTWMAENPMMVVLIAFVVYRVVSQSGPFPEAGGRVVSVHDEAEWQKLLEQAASGKKLLVADFYATWCPPCRSAAPVFGQLSTEFLGCDFVKVDVDSCAAVARREGIKAMPTFKIYEKQQCVQTIQGFQKNALVSALGERGAARTTADKAGKAS
mmetsp:Transcript_14072/g.44386  ORF Transcript_14072/g.44386 Transcript_14072/m.44386 type:complete len:161 (-) Transcript_14072:161-643(-)